MQAKTVKRNTEVIGIASGKGGVGKTTLSTNLAVALTMMNKKVMLLDGDLGLALDRVGGHLGDALDLGELAFQRLGHRGGHGLGAGAGEAGVDGDGGEFDARQGRNRQEREGGDTDQDDGGHDQRGADRAADERG